jgi:hypothetical protein
MTCNEGADADVAAILAELEGDPAISRAPKLFR